MKILFALFVLLPSFAMAEPDLGKLRVPAGRSIAIYAYPVPGARSLTLGKDGMVFVGSRTKDKVYSLLADKNSDGKADGIRVVAKGLNSPNGVAYRNGDLFVAEISRILRIRKADTDKPAKPEAWGPSFPDKEHHGWKFIAFGPDGWLYVPVGAPCNICLEDQDLFAAIHRVSPDGKKREVVARGIRNTVGFDWQPGTGDLWFTDNGRDLLGDDIPPDELNHLTKLGGHFGFPFCHAGDIIDPEFGKNKKCGDYLPPAAKFPAHVAALGMRFLKKQKDKTLNGDILVAQHGSWNRSSPIGYQVVHVTIKNGKAGKLEPFLSGFLQDGKPSGRPVDILELGDGSILVSDDESDAVYRISP
jgi:glucose/arabinose dehydrogenase